MVLAFPGIRTKVKLLSRCVNFSYLVLGGVKFYTSGAAVHLLKCSLTRYTLLGSMKHLWYLQSKLYIIGGGEGVQRAKIG